MKCISYSLFGYGKERQDNCFDFNSYLRGFMVNVRMNRLIYPEWEIVLHTDNATYEAFVPLLEGIKGVRIVVCRDAPLCLAMLWRMKPVFEVKENNAWKYTHVICRDLDSPTTYREAQAVQYWINKDKAMHAITDSVSHNLPLLGGMIGVRPDYFTAHVAKTWIEMIEMGEGMSFEKKGTDQAFLNKFIYPKFSQHGSDSITQHYFNGMPNSHLMDYRTCECPPTSGHDAHCYNNIELSIPFELSESNSVCGHIGSAGYYSTAMFQFLRKHKNKFENILEAEKQFPIEFYWTQDDTFK